MYSIYKITTLENGKVYIGCTKMKMPLRLACHKSTRKLFVLSPHKIEILHDGVEPKEKALLLEQYYIEKFDSTNPQKGWNRRFSGERQSFPEFVTVGFGKLLQASRPGELNGMYGRKQSEETREKIRLKAIGRKSALKGRKLSEEQRIKRNTARAGKGYLRGKDHPMYGRHHSEEAKRKIGQANSENEYWLGRKHSEESKLKMSLTKKAKAAVA